MKLPRASVIVAFLLLLVACSAFPSGGDKQTVAANPNSNNTAVFAGQPGATNSQTSTPPLSSPPDILLPTPPPRPSSPAGTTHVPIVVKLVPASQNVAARSFVTLTVTTGPPVSARSNFTWFVDSGPRADLAAINGDQEQAVFVAPGVPSGLGQYKIRVVVTDADGGTDSATATVQVISPRGLMSAAPELANEWKADRDTQDALGFATAPPRAKPDDRANPPAAEEAFQNGYMFWIRSDYDGATRIYAIFNSDHTWAAFLDTWRQGADPDFLCTKPSTPPERGFAKVWCLQPGVRAKLGKAEEYELGQGQMAQDFENGMMLRSLDYNKTYILFNDQTWR